MTLNPDVATFAADGGRLPDRSLSSITRLLSLSLVVVRRNFRGAIVRAHFRSVSGANPLRRSAHIGTRYSYQEHTGDDSAYRTWRHRRLVQSTALDREQAELFVRAVFLEVPLSCMSRPTLPIDRLQPKHTVKPWNPESMKMAL